MKKSNIVLASTLLLTSLSFTHHAEAATNYKDIDYSNKTVVKSIKKGTLTKVNGVTLDSKLSSYSKSKYDIVDSNSDNFISVNSKDKFSERDYNSLTAVVDFSDNKSKALKVTRFIDYRTGKGFSHPKKFTLSKMRSLYGEPTRSIEYIKAYDDNEVTITIDFYKNATFMYSDSNDNGKSYLERTYILGKTLKSNPKKWQSFIRSSFKSGASASEKVKYSYWYGKK